MTRKSLTPPGSNHLITSFISGTKRSADHQRIRSPTNETSSPEKKNLKPDQPATADIPMEETPAEESTAQAARPHSDNRQSLYGEDAYQGTHIGNETAVSEHITNPDALMETDPPRTVEEKSHVASPKLISPQRDKTPSHSKEDIRDKQRLEAPQQSNEEVPTESLDPKKIERTSLKQQKLPSAIRKGTYLEKAGTSFPPPLLPQWKCHRIACMFEIDRPENKSIRTQVLANELNKMLAAAREYVDREKVYVQKYKDHYIPRDNERKEWISQFDKKKASDLNLYTFGFYAFQEPRGGMHRLLVQLVIPVTTNIPDLLMNINNHVWSSKKGRRVMDIKEQNLHSPKNIGWLFRSNYLMAASTELQDEFETRGGIHFGLTFKTIPLVQKGKYNKDTAVKAIYISTNEEDKEIAWKLLMEWYNTKKAKYPLGVQMKFVPSKDHPDIANNPTAIQNISVLMERQRIFLEDTDAVQCVSLAMPDTPIDSGNRTLRNELMTLTATTMGKEYLGARLFHAISLKVTLAGERSYHFTYHKVLEREALSVVCGLGPFIKKELKLQPDAFCFPHALDPTHKWDKKTRSVSNQTTSYLEELAGKHKEDVIDLEAAKEKYNMSDKNKREARRIIGLNDEETVAGDLTQPKASFSEVPKEIRDDSSTGSALSGLTNYSTSTAASKERKALRHQITDQQAELDEQAAEIARLTKAINAIAQKQKSVELDTTTEKRVKAMQSKENTLNDGESSSGENTSELPGKDGWDSDIEFSDEVETKEPAPKEVIALQDSDDEKEHEIDFYDSNGNAISYLKDVDPSVDGLKFLARGSLAEIRMIQKGLIDRPSLVTNPFRFNDNDDEWVELFEIIDATKFSKEYSNTTSSRSTAVWFSAQGQVQEFDPDKAKLQTPVEEVLLDDDSNSDPGDDSVDSNGSAGNESGEYSSKSSDPSASSGCSSTSSNLIASNKSGDEKTSTQKPTNITFNILNDAQQIASSSSDTTGSGKSFNV